MKNKLPLKFWWLFFCEVVWRLIAWIIIPFTMPFLKKADMSEIQDKIPYGIGTDIQRYVFPKWAECVEMIDDWNWPEYEPSMSNMRKRFGWRVATYINLAFRNVGMSLTAQLAKPVSNYWYAISDQEKAEKGLFDNHYRLGNIVLKVGWISYRDWKCKFGDTGFFSIPRVTLRYEKEIDLGGSD